MMRLRGPLLLLALAWLSACRTSQMIAAPSCQTQMYERARWLLSRTESAPLDRVIYILQKWVLGKGEGWPGLADAHNLAGRAYLYKVSTDRFGVFQSSLKKDWITAAAGHFDKAATLYDQPHSAVRFELPVMRWMPEYSDPRFWEKGRRRRVIHYADRQSAAGWMRRLAGIARNWFSAN